MTAAFRRTGRTALSDAEVMLLDALFDKKDTLDSLRQPSFSEAHNLPYAHGLDDAALEQTVSRLQRAGLVRRSRPRAPETARSRIWLTLTPRGGAFWVRERRPDWTRYCTDASWPEQGDDRWVLSVRSPSLRTARSFLETAAECALYDADPRAAVVRRRKRCRLIPWRVFPTIFELRVALRMPDGAKCNWTVYERQRIWWSSISELGGPGDPD